MKCPNCGRGASRDSADVGVGIIYGPWGCACGWSEWDEYNQLLGNGGIQRNGSYVDSKGGVYPPESAVAKELRRQAE